MTYDTKANIIPGGVFFWKGRHLSAFATSTELVAFSFTDVRFYGRVQNYVPASVEYVRSSSDPPSQILDVATNPSRYVTYRDLSIRMNKLSSFPVCI